MKKFVCPLLALALFLLPACACAEISSQDEAFMRECFALARKSIQRGDDPFGAVLVKDGKIIMRADNTVHTDDDFSRHAEINLMSAAIREYGAAGIKDTTLYSSCEPCVMCAGAIELGEGLIVRMVYGLPGERLVEMVGEGKPLSDRSFYKWADNRIDVEGPVLQAEAEDVIREYLALHHKR
jgi:tRNA(Arg) A34 adenosine deaminase TadA